MRVAIVGSRNFSKEQLEKAYEIICRCVPANATEIVSGGAVGIDRLAELYAKQNKLPTKIFLPDYQTHGKRAPIVRNVEIIKYSQFVIALWDGISRGTAYTVTSCIKEGVPVKVYTIEN